MRVLMTIQPAFSHATQVIPLARELERRGHVVTVATSATYAATLVRLGLDARSVGPDWMLRPGDEVFDRTIGQQGFFGFVQVPDRSSVEDLLRLARETGAQLIVRDYTEFGGWAVAQRSGADRGRMAGRARSGRRSRSARVRTSSPVRLSGSRPKCW